jgi:hypothetical protein
MSGYGRLHRGVIVAPMRADFMGSGPLVRFTVNGDELATDRPISAVGFMPLRQQRTPYADLSGVDFDGGEVIQTTTEQPQPPSVKGAQASMRPSGQIGCADARTCHRRCGIHRLAPC